MAWGLIRWAPGILGLQPRRLEAHAERWKKLDTIGANAGCPVNRMARTLRCTYNARQQHKLSILSSLQSLTTVWARPLYRCLIPNVFLFFTFLVLTPFALQHKSVSSASSLRALIALSSRPRPGCFLSSLVIVVNKPTTTTTTTTTTATHNHPHTPSHTHTSP